LFLVNLIYLNCASDAAPQHGAAAPDRTPDFSLFFYFNFLLFILIVHQVPLHNKEYQSGHQTFFIKHKNKNKKYASGAAAQLGVAALDGAPDVFNK
jgi:hypothetical protein